MVMRVPLEGGGRLVVELSPDEATALSRGPEGRDQLNTAATCPPAAPRTDDTASAAGEPAGDRGRAVAPGRRSRRPAALLGSG